MGPEQLTQSLKAEAQRLGFQIVAACPALSPTGYTRFEEWLAAGFAGEMHYLEERKAAYRHPDSILNDVKSLLLLGMNYRTVPAASNGSGYGRIARYAWGQVDYHDLIHSRLKSLRSFVKTLLPKAGVRGVVDTAPLLEREFAELAGLGWRAKNTLLINKHQGSWLFLAALLLDTQLEYDEPVTQDHCGTCRACLDACPTNAFVKPFVLDATKCISYLTIEHRTAIPIDMRSQMGNWILGCDICQEVCPWNHKAPLADEEAFAPLDGHNPIELRPLFWLTDEEFRARFRKTPLWRPKRRGILRNAAIALGNFPCCDNLDALVQGLNDAEPLLRGASVWALGQHGMLDEDVRKQAQSELQKRLRIENDVDVVSELEMTISSLKK